MQTLELKIPPPVVTLLVGVAMWISAHAGPVLTLPLSTRLSAFIVLALSGIGTAFIGSREFRRAKTTLSPLKPESATSLVTSGIYQFTRNPMYLGLTLFLMGWVAFLGSAVSLLGPVVFVLYISRFQIAPEERALLAHFGEAYQAYMARVHRWL